MTIRAVRPTGPTAQAAVQVEAALADVAPQLQAGFRTHLPRAMDVVARRLIDAAYREGLTGGPAAATWTGDQVLLPAADGGYLVARARRHAFDRLAVAEPVAQDPAHLVRRLTGDRAGAAIEAELSDAVVNLALAYARRDEPATDPGLSTVEADPDVACVRAERLATEGHNLHPCGRTRLGWTVRDLLAHDLESSTGTVGFVAVRRDLHVGDEIDLVGERRDGYAVTPVHPWQLREVVRGRHAGLVAEGALIPLDAELPALTTGAVRTLLLPGTGQYVKVSLDIQITSTRRTISVASTRNGPRLSALLARLLPECGEHVLLMAETAGSAMVVPGGERDVSAILRTGLAGRLHPGEEPVPGAALYAVSPHTGRSVVADLVTRSGLSAAAWLVAYAGLLLPPVLRLSTRHGIGLEAHLQNCVPTFRSGVPYRLALRDLAGLRVHPPRLSRGGPWWPGSVIVADDVAVMLSKVAYTAVQAHLAELVICLATSHGLDEAGAWSAVRSLVDDVYADLAAEPGLAGRARADHAFLTAPTVPHKALLRMRLDAGRGGGGDRYVPVENPLR